MKFSEILQIAEDSSFVHPAAKKVPAVVHTAIYKKSGNGNDMLAVTYRVTGGPNAGKGRPIRHYLMFDRTTGQQQASNLGFPAAEFAKLAGLDAEDAIGKIAAVVLGKPCLIDIEQETFNNKQQNKVTWVHPPSTGGAGPKPAAAAAKPAAKADPEASAEDSELQRLERELEAARAAAKPATRTAAPDDLPF